ncbi:helix-turn-helix domain-containing protein [Oligella urethralis]
MMKTLQQVIAEQSIESQQRIKEGADKLILETGLALLREEIALSQKELAKQLGVSQPAIVQIEQRGADLKLKTLKRYIEAMGGQLSLTVTMPTGDNRTFSI